MATENAILDEEAKQDTMKVAKKPRGVYVIIVTFNFSNWYDKVRVNLKDLCRRFNVVFVDNNSSDDTIAILKGFKCHLIELKKNIGFGKANNVGIEHVIRNDYRYIVFLNQDASITSSEVSNLIKEQIKHPEYGVLSPIHLSGDGHVDYLFSDCLLKENTPRMLSDVVTGKVKDIYETRFVNAAIWLVSKSTIETIGGFMPLFPHYGEDNNYLNRCIYHGIKIGLIPDCFGVHYRDQHTDRLKNRSFVTAFHEIHGKSLATLTNINYNRYEVIKEWMKNNLRLLFRNMDVKIFLILIYSAACCLKDIVEINKCRNQSKRTERLYIW
ncbi:MAG: glycosyltransferase family 2 protein [Bacteroidota bacterium]